MRCRLKAACVRSAHTLPRGLRLLQLVISRCTEIESGGRMIDAILTNTILPQISRELLSRTAEGNKIQTIDISVQDGDFIYRYLE
ncbi:hypothetical protein ELB75_00720 [Eikenella corrodens]|uniref:Clp ATPase C-terminal domain-containing protein n=1 Tax=Eikenella corrodens TaxID=539 RepID=A0A3S9SGQ6_EIKCO|nr:hypothetical protein ELB75_00720 [Eikenella corrodens]